MVCHHRSGLSPGLLFVAAAEAVGPAVVVYEDLVRLSKAFQKQFFKAPTPSKRSLNSGLLFISGKQAKALAPVRGYFSWPARQSGPHAITCDKSCKARPLRRRSLSIKAPTLRHDPSNARAPAPIRGYFLPSSPSSNPGLLFTTKRICNLQKRSGSSPGLLFLAGRGSAR